MEYIFVALFILLGGAVGSFLNVCIDRLPAGKSLVHPPSRCDACGRRLTLIDLVPVLSYIFLRGRCRYCHSGIPLRVPGVEICGAAAFALAYWRYGTGVEAGVFAYYCCIFIVLGVIDLEHRLIPNKIVYPAVAIAIPVAALLSGTGIASGAIGGATGLGLMLVPALVSRGGMGWGDVKMAALIGFASGFPLVFVSLFTGVLLGGATAALLVLLRIKKWGDAVPFGPFLSLAAITTLVWGKDILSWYLGLL